MEKDGINSFGAYLELITNRNPVVHQITNFVTANDCANAVLAMGGRTVMADYIEEIEEIFCVIFTTGSATSVIVSWFKFLFNSKNSSFKFFQYLNSEEFTKSFLYDSKK